jgi:CHAD domain-containing protein
MDLRAVAKKLRSSAFLRRIRRGPKVGGAAREIVRALLATPPVAARAVSIGRRPRPPARVEGDPPASLSAHLGHIVHRRLGQLSECLSFADAEDPVEALHDLRVASRRLRAFIGLFEPMLERRIVVHVEKPLKRITRGVSELRDIDVHVKDIEERVRAQTTDAGRAALEHLLERLASERLQAEAHARKRLRKVDPDEVNVGVCAALGETVARLPESSAEEAELTWKLIEPLVLGAERAEPPLEGASAEALHRFRIALKKLRYGLELIEPLLGEDHGELARRAASLQELLGAHHDLSVIGALVDDERQKLEARGRKTLPFALTTFRGDLESEERALAERFRAERTEPGHFRNRIRAALEKEPGPG